MARGKNKTTEQKLADAISKKESLKQELKETESIISGLERQLKEEELTKLSEIISTSNYTIQEVIDLITSSKEHTA